MVDKQGLPARVLPDLTAEQMWKTISKFQLSQRKENQEYWLSTLPEPGHLICLEGEKWNKKWIWNRITVKA